MPHKGKPHKKKEEKKRPDISRVPKDPIGKSLTDVTPAEARAFTERGRDISLKKQREGVSAKGREVDIETAQKEIIEREKGKEIEPGRNFILRLGEFIKKAAAAAGAPIETKAGEEISQLDILAATPIGGPAKGAKQLGTIAKGVRTSGITKKVAVRKVVRGNAQASRALIGGVLDLARGNPLATWQGKLGVGWVLVTQNRLSNVDSALSQIRETFSIVVSNVATKGWTTTEGFERLNDLEEQILDYEADAKLLGMTPTSLATGRLLPILQRVTKLKDVLPGVRAQIATIEAKQLAGIELDDEELTLMLADLNELLEGFGQPSKFLGVI